MLTLVIIVIVTLVTASFCSLCEAALYAVSHARLEQLSDSGTAQGKRLYKLRQDVDRPIAAILTLNTIAEVVGATLAGSVAASLFGSWGVGLFSAGFTLAILYCAEIVPKTLGVLYADALAPHLALPIQSIIWFLWPLVWACQQLTRLIPRTRARLNVASEEDLLALTRIGARAGALRPEEARWIHNALKLDTVKVFDILTPRTVVFSIPQETPVTEAADLALTWNYTRVPITEQGDLDHITGLVIRREVLAAVLQGRTNLTLADVKRPPTFVPESMRVSDLLAKFLRERQHLFIAVDEYGGTAGVVTLEDAVESLLGSEILDEFDRHADLQHLARRRAAAKLKDLELDEQMSEGSAGSPRPA